MTLVQHIETTWFKNERGAMHGTLRNKTPEAVQIPINNIIANAEDTVIHNVCYARTTSDINEDLRIQTGKNIHIGSLFIEPAEQFVSVNFTWDYASSGKPVRWQRGRNSWTLNKNEWCRFRYNGRLMLEHTWQYKITTLNIGNFDTIISDCFQDKTPNYFENMVRLW